MRCGDSDANARKCIDNRPSKKAFRRSIEAEGAVRTSPTTVRQRSPHVSLRPDPQGTSDRVGPGSAIIEIDDAPIHARSFHCCRSSFSRGGGAFGELEHV